MKTPTTTTILTALLAVSSSFVDVSAHKEPKTEKEVEVQRAMQAAAYHCAPAIEQYTASRKRSWAQKVLAGNPSLPGYEDLFAGDTYSAASSSSTPPSPNNNGGEYPGPITEEEGLLACAPVSEVKIQNNTCVLTPETTEGPYYHTEGHPIRQNIAELQDGLLMLLDIGVIDVETCQPIPNILVDIWHANATGHYAGHPFPRPSLADEVPQVGGKRNGLLSAFPRTEPEETWLRGAWPTNSNGVSQFTSIFPGYYTGRATHVHAKVFTDYTVLENGTFTGGKLHHVGQFFVDDALNSVVDKMHPYTTNPIREIRGRTRNWRDSLNIFEDSFGPEGKYDPVFKMHLLGGTVAQGVAGFITMGVNASAVYENKWRG